MGSRLILQKAIIEETLKALKKKKNTTKNISISIRNPLEGKSQWLDFPMPENELNAIMDEITFDGSRDHEIVDIEGFTFIPTQDPYILNEIAKKLDESDLGKLEFLMTELNYDLDAAVAGVDEVMAHENRNEMIYDYIEDYEMVWDANQIITYVGRAPDLREMIYDEIKNSHSVAESSTGIWYSVLV